MDLAVSLRLRADRDAAGETERPRRDPDDRPVCPFCRKIKERDPAYRCVCCEPSDGDLIGV
ncbi:MAG: hypothetical protein KJ000_28685 [Pirellulaceae bacterium]|nr:hypothetical protein [Pirellulaceae bacterium]